MGRLSEDGRCRYKTRYHFCMRPSGVLGSQRGSTGTVNLTFLPLNFISIASPLSPTWQKKTKTTTNNKNTGVSFLNILRRYLEMQVEMLNEQLAMWGDLGSG